MPYCRNCGKEVTETAKFCSACGAQKGAIPVGIVQSTSKGKSTSILLALFLSFGIGIVVLGIPFASSSTLAYMRAPETIWSTRFPGENGLGFLVTFMFGCIGSILALVGGLMARPRFVWILFIVVGLLYCFSLSGIYYDTYKQLSYPLAWPSTSYKDYLYDTILLLPGIAFIVGGLIICKPKKTKR